jgi:hypothetical protein
MKTLKRNSDVIRAKEKDVKSYLNNGYNYCPKSEWKKLEKKEEKKEKNKK